MWAGLEDPRDPGYPGWTLNTLAAYVTQLLAERDQRYTQRMDAIEHMFNVVLSDQAERTRLALSAADRAVAKSEAASDRRFESVNEFRRALTDQTAAFVTRREFEAARSAGTERIDELKERMDRSTGVAEGGHSRTLDQRAALASYVGVAALVISIIIVVADLLTRH